MSWVEPASLPWHCLNPQGATHPHQNPLFSASTCVLNSLLQTDGTSHCMYFTAVTLPVGGQTYESTFHTRRSRGSSRNTVVPFYLRVQSSHLQIRLCSVNCFLPAESWVLTTLGRFSELFDALQKIPHFLLWFLALGGLWRMPHHITSLCLAGKRARPTWDRAGTRAGVLFRRSHIWGRVENEVGGD